MVPVLNQRAGVFSSDHTVVVEKVPIIYRGEIWRKDSMSAEALATFTGYPGYLLLAAFEVV